MDNDDSLIEEQSFKLNDDENFGDTTEEQLDSLEISDLGEEEEGSLDKEC